MRLLIVLPFVLIFSIILSHILIKLYDKFMGEEEEKEDYPITMLEAIEREKKKRTRGE